MANKKVKQGVEKRQTASAKEDFDIFTKGPGSPSKMTKRFKAFVDPSGPQYTGKFNAEDLVPPGQDEDFVRQAELRRLQRPTGDPFQDLGVGGTDKMTFFLLKWVFNAIKRDSADDDPSFQGKSFVSKSDLGKQLSKNPELMHALGYTDGRALTENVKLAPCKKDGFLLWSEFCDFFFAKEAGKPAADGDEWWN